MIGIQMVAEKMQYGTRGETQFSDLNFRALEEGDGTTFYGEGAEPSLNLIGGLDLSHKTRKLRTKN